ncbi:MAG TPA: hypothetical protein DCM10_05710 [Xanthomarina gelatinilytica]|jgi:uncharacterized protein YuzE|nr:hypothetical protein [Xanthomarina gelatinilytica]|tara:strand:+ start:331 stop:573 length:243 start_codon:yes stop_codon:yes gene_type:complete
MEQYTEYNDENRISYNQKEDTMYVWKAPCQGTLGSVLLYRDAKDNTMVALDTDEVGTIVGIELIGVKKLMQKFEKNHGNN